jgi:hypothetical protein
MSEVEFLDVDAIDAGGRPVVSVLFDPDALDAAYAELDARWDAGEAASHPQMAAAARTMDLAWAHRDWDAVHALCAPSFVYHDHRLLGWGTLPDAAAWVRTQRALVDLAPDVRIRRDHVRMCDRGCMVQLLQQGTRDGGAFERAFTYVAELDDAGRYRRYDVYDTDRFDEAKARFDEIAANAATAATPAPRFPNAATRAMDRGHDAFEARDWNAFAALLAPDFRSFDRRALLQLETDREQWLASYRQIVEMTSGRPLQEVLATRGERLVLARSHWQGAAGDIGPSAIDWLLIIELDARGDHRAVVAFDPDDLDAAYTELDARYDAGEGAATTGAPACLPQFARLVARRDWDALAATFASTVVAHDHRLVSWGTLEGPVEYSRALRTLVDLAPDVRLRVHHLRASAGGELFEAAWQGTRDGGPFEIPVVGVVELDAERKQRRFDLYDVDKLEQARARFAAIATSVLPNPLRIPPNAATRAVESIWSYADAGDWGALRALVAPVAYEDRRRLLRVAGDGEVLLANIRQTWAMNLRPVPSVPTTFGERLALYHSVWRVTENEQVLSEAEGLGLWEVDGAGRVVAFVIFDSDGRRAALREAWARWAALDPVVAPWVELLNETTDRWNDRSSPSSPRFADDLIVEDHRRTGFGRIEGADAYSQSIVALWELAPDQRLELGWFWPAVDRDCALVSVRREGTLPDGGAFESDYLALFAVTGGRVTRLEFFEVDALDRALARFAELSDALAT